MLCSHGPARLILASDRGDTTELLNVFEPSGLRIVSRKLASQVVLGEAGGTKSGLPTLLRQRQWAASSSREASWLDRTELISDLKVAL